MFSLEKLVSIGFSIAQATVLNKLFKRVGYAAPFKKTDLVAEAVLPDNKIIEINGIEGLKEIFKSSTQFYTDIETIFVQRGNNDPWQGRVETVVVYQVTEQNAELSDGEGVVYDWASAIDNFVKVNANWSQLVISSREPASILAAAKKANTNSRLFIGQCEDDTIAGAQENNIAELLKGFNVDNALLFYHPDAEFISGGIAGILAQNQLGLTGPLFATVTNCQPQDYSDSINNNLEKLNVASYQYVNPVNGGGVQEYATPIVRPAKQVTGMDTKRQYTKFCIDLLLKAKAIDFLKRALTYEDISAKVLDSELSSVLIELQRGDGAFKRLVKLDTTKSDGTVIKGFDLRVGRPSDLQDTQPTAYNTQTYPVVGYYRDALTGQKIEISLNVDPNMSTLALLGFIE